MAIKTIVGVDPGCKYVKIWGPYGPMHFETISTPKSENLKGFGSRFPYKDPFEFSYKGETYYYGEHAAFMSRARKLPLDDVANGKKDNDDAIRRTFAAICRYLATYDKKFNEEEDIEVYLVYGSPITDAGDDNYVEGVSNKLLNNNQPHEVTYNGEEYNIYVKDLEVIAEGLAAYIADPDESSTESYIADAGSATFNFVEVIDGQPVETPHPTLNYGVEYVKELYGDGAAKQAAMVIKNHARNKLGWPEGITIKMAGGFAKQIKTEFDKLPDNPYKMAVIEPKYKPSGAKKERLVESMYANAQGLYELAVQWFTPEEVKG